MDRLLVATCSVMFLTGFLLLALAPERVFGPPSERYVPKFEVARNMGLIR